MALQNVTAQLDAWRNSVLQQTMPLLTNARAQLGAAQGTPDADERIGKIEELLTARLEPIFLEQDDGALAPIRKVVDAYFETAESPSEADYAVQTRAGSALDELRDWHQRKIRSLVAQAQAHDLSPACAAPPAASAARFCKQCGAPV